MMLSKFKYDATSKSLQQFLDTFEECGVDREELAEAMLQIAIGSNHPDLVSLITEQM